MTAHPTKAAVQRYFARFGLIEGRDYTYGGLRTQAAREGISLLGIETFSGFWRTYRAEMLRKTDYAHWPSFEAAAAHIIDTIRYS